MSSSHSPCAACKLQRRKCTQECIFSPYFPPDQPQKFANVHKVFGASNVAKLLNELSIPNREDAVTSLAYEAEARLRDPVYGCVGVISVLQQRLRQIQIQLLNAKKELAAYIGPSAMLPVTQNGLYMQQQQYMHDNTSTSSLNPYNMPPPPMLGLHSGGVGQLTINEPQQNQHQQQQQQILEQQQIAAAMAASRGRQQQQQEQGMLILDNGFEGDGMVGHGSSFNQMTMTQSLTLGSFEDHHQHHQLQLQLQPQLFPQTPNEPQYSQHQQGFGSEEGRNVGPSC